MTQDRKRQNSNRRAEFDEAVEKLRRRFSADLTVREYNDELAQFEANYLDFPPEDLRRAIT